MNKVNFLNSQHIKPIINFKLNYFLGNLFLKNEKNFSNIFLLRKE